VDWVTRLSPAAAEGETCNRAKYRWRKTTLFTVAAGIDKSSLFWVEAGENLELCSVTEYNPIYTGCWSYCQEGTFR